MKKLYKFIILLMFIALSTNLMAADYIVSGAGTTAVNGTYTTDGTNSYGAPRWKHTSGAYYLHSNGSSQWSINTDGSFPGMGYYRNSSQSPFNKNIPPFTGWLRDIGSDPAPTVGDAGPGLSYNSGTFTESSANDGSIDNSQPVIITHNNFEGATFTGSNGDNFVADGKAVVTNLPAGFTAVIGRTGSTTLSVTLTGTASAHANANDVSNLTFTFQNSAFSTGDASAINNSVKSDIKINFIQIFTVASSGGDYTTIEAAISAASSGDIINVAGGEFTENELVVDRNLTIIGQGSANTFIQAAATYNTATHRVFHINSGISATIKNATVRYGRYELMGTAAGIWNENGNLTLQNVDLSYNVFGNWGNGGGINSSGILVIDNCTIHHNIAAWGAGILTSNTATITNSTITANSANNINNPAKPYSANYGGGIYLQGSLTLTNSTISKNICRNDPALYETFGPSSGLCNNYAALTITNSILADNETSDYRVQAGVGQITDNGSNIVKYQVMYTTDWLLTATTDILYNYKADKTTSTSWNRNNAALANQNLNISSTLASNGTLNGTQTLALLSGSFAINAGTGSGAPTTDQRGYYRNSTTDIGSYEFEGIEPAPAPTAQPTNLTFSNTKTGDNFNIVVNYTASSSANGYLVVRKAGSEPSFVPVNSTTYISGVQGSDQIVYVGTAVTCTDATVTTGTAYYYKIYAYNGSGTSTTYLTTNPLKGNSTLNSSTSGALTGSASSAVSAGFPNTGVNVTFPNGTTGTSLTVAKTAAAPTSNFSALPGVRGVKNLYYTITSSNATPGTYTLVMDFSDLGLTSGQWANFKVLKRTNATSAWVDVTSVGATIVSRQTDGVWGKFTISGLSNFSEFALGESFDGVIVSNLNQDIIAAMEGNTVNFNAQAFTTNGTNYDLTWATLSIWNADAPANAVLKLYGASTNGEIDLAGGILVTFGTPTLGDLVGDNYNARFYPTSPASFTLQANTTYWLVFSSSTISDFNTTLSLGYSGAGTLLSVKNNAQSDDGGISYTYYDDQPFLIAVNGNIIPTVITWDGSDGTNWNTAANWDLNSVPIADNLVVIPGTGSGVTSWPVVNEAPATPAVCYDLTINAGGILSVNPGKALTVNGTLNNIEGVTGLSIESDATDGSGSLLHHTANVPAYISTTITGSATLTNYKYHLVSVPLTPSSNSLSSLFQDCYLYDFDVANNVWHSLGTSTTTDLDETKGYMVYFPGVSATYFFDGNLNAGEFTPTIINTGDGYNLVPNPYPSSIDWNAASGWTKNNINNATWIWNGSNLITPYGPGIVGNYAAYVNGSGTNGGSRYIAPGQAFFVKTNAASPVLTMTDAVRLHNATPFLKSGESIADLLRVKATANNYSDEVVVRFAGEATPGADAAFDAEKMYGLENAPQLYTLTPDMEKLSINSLPFSTGSTVVPMSFELEANTSCTLTFSEMEGFEPETNIFLDDLLTGAKINLRQQSVYSFNHLTGNDPNRFKLWFGGVTAIPETATQTAKMWINGNNLYINTTELKGQLALVEVYNASGQRLIMKSMVLVELTTLELNVKGFVIVKLTSGQKVLTTKGIIMK